MSHNDQINICLRQFKNMGASAEQLTDEYRKLLNDQAYLSEWVNFLLLGVY